jgi:hypothetical protein
MGSSDQSRHPGGTFAWFAATILTGYIDSVGISRIPEAEKRSLIRLLGLTEGYDDYFDKDSRDKIIDLFNSLPEKERNLLYSSLSLSTRLDMLLNDAEDNYIKLGHEKFFERLDHLVRQVSPEGYPSLTRRFFGWQYNTLFRIFEKKLHAVVGLTGILLESPGIMSHLHDIDPNGGKELNDQWKPSISVTLYNIGTKHFQSDAPIHVMNNIETVFSQALRFPNPPVMIYNNLLAVYWYSGQFEKMLKMVDEIQPIAHRNPYIYHHGACIYVKFGHLERALEQVKLARKHNYVELHQMKNDKDLKPLWPLPEFRAIFSEQRK